MYNIISTGSHGNCVTYFNNSIMIDCGVSYKAVSQIVNEVQIILLTHCHGDHIKEKTIAKMQFENPKIRIACGEWLADELQHLNNVDVLELGKLYDYKLFQISPFRLYHDVLNCGWRIFKDNKKIFHATDTAHLEGITAKNYDLYAIEHNYNDDIVEEVIQEDRKNNRFCRIINSVNTHLSSQQAREFYKANCKDNSELIKLHISNTYG